MKVRDHIVTSKGIFMNMFVFHKAIQNKNPLYIKGFEDLCMVETSGIEPLTFWLPAKRSPS
jgi:hypothetical protein